MKRVRIRGRTAGAAALVMFASAGAVAVAAEPALAAGRCVIGFSPRPQMQWAVESRCVPRASGDKVARTYYKGADWPDPDDWLFVRNSPALADRFIVSWASLNEDNVSRDEVYTENSFVRPNGSVYWIKSNEVHKNFL